VRHRLAGLFCGNCDEEIKMASGLRYDPYSQPTQFMDSIIADMKQTFVERIADVKNEVSAKLAEVDAALAAINDVKAQREQSVRMECLRLASQMEGGCNSDYAARTAKKLADLVLTGKKPGAEG
jgi:Mg-chelatase subunit ChlI